MKRILLTGATGFIGSSLIHHLNLQDRSVTAAVRYIIEKNLPHNVQQVAIDGSLSNTDWALHLNNVDAVIHLAARVHVMRDNVIDPLTDFRRTNTAATLNLAQQAAAVGVRRFIYLSSIKVNGEITASGQPFTTDSLRPCGSGVRENKNGGRDPYAQSKHEAEEGLRSIARQTGMEVTIIRPPLVYGQGVKGNFYGMLKWLDKGIPLPLGAIYNHRSFIALDNLIDLITVCIDHPSATNQTFLASDGDDLSTTELLQRLSLILGKPAHLLPIPQSWLQAVLTLLGKRAIAQRLLGNLQIDISSTKEILGWTPPVSVDEGLQKTVEWYLSQK